MSLEIRISLAVILTVSVIVYTVFFFPALTAGGYGNAKGVSEAEFAAVFAEELAYCRAQPDAVNCRCFAGVSGTIIVHKTPRVPTAIYADRKELARGQASASC